MRYDMVAGIVGFGDIDDEAMSALLDWYLPENSLVLIHSAHAGSQTQVYNWCAEVGQDYQIIQGDVLDALLKFDEESQDLSLIVLGVEDTTGIIKDAWANDIEVIDLTRAAYPVTQGIDLEDILYEPVTHAHEVTDGLGGRGSLDIFAPQDVLQSDDRIKFSIPPEIRRKFPMPDEPALSQADLVEKLVEIMTGLIQVHEEKYHAPETEGVVIGQLPSDAQITIAGNLEIVQSNTSEKIRCLKNIKTGKIRVSPRAKAKDGEQETWLTQEEIDAAK